MFDFTYLTLSLLSLFSSDLCCRKISFQGCRQLLTTGGGRCKPPAGPGQSPGGGSRGKAPGSSEEPAIYTT